MMSLSSVHSAILITTLLVLAASPARASTSSSLVAAPQEPAGDGPAQAPPAAAPSPSPPEPPPPPGGPIGGPLPEVVSPRPTVISPGDQHTAPTANLTRLANAIGLRHRSFTTLIFTPPGLALTRPMDIRITYISPMNVPQQVQASYVASTGTRFLYNDVVGDGSKRRMTFDITLIERRPVQPPIEYSFFWQMDLDPVFDVSTGPLTFKLRSDCDWVGESEIELLMLMPDGTHRNADFGLSGGGTRNVDEFVWSRAEATASLGLKQPFVTFLDDDPNYSLFTGGPTFLVEDTPPLIPGETHVVSFRDGEDTDDCSADISFTETHTPRYYYYLSP